MDTWLLWYLSTIAIAFVIIVGDSAIGRKLFVTEALAAAVTVGALGSTWIAFFVSAYYASLTANGIYVAWGITALLAALRLPGFVRNLPGLLRRTSLDDIAALVLLALISLIIWPTYNGRMIPGYGEQLVTGGSCYGDLPIHMTIANSFLVGCNTEIKLSGMMSPIFAGRDMTYPFLPGASFRWGRAKWSERYSVRFPLQTSTPPSSSRSGAPCATASCFPASPSPARSGCSSSGSASASRARDSGRCWASPSS